jgi:ribosomal protein S18 acetylase RimI-like enzyme
MPSLSLLTKPNSRQIVQITALYRQAGWWDDDAPDDPELVARIVAGSHCFVIASLDEAIVGMGRAISDRASDGYLQDITVQETYRKQGLGSRIVAMLIDRLHHDGIEWIGLIAEMESYPVYEKLGFQRLAGGTPLVLHK